MLDRAKPMPPLDFLRGILSYNPETGKLTWTSKVSSKTIIGSEAGTLHKASGRYQVQIQGKIYKSSRIAFYLYYGFEPVGAVDHINRDPSDDRISNLRDASLNQNGMNKSMMSNNTSGYKGVSYSKRRNEYIAYVKINGKMMFGGWFKKKEEAAKVAASMRESIHGEFCNHE
ncbi:HNH endonuclease [Escherichia phage vB_EcoS_AKS96]|uniref:HNH endonuclease n=1 Tax=Escherichia phage vB_EcoS_AKS96 TaxID=1416031 RepID=A0A067YYU7_9CAUD|nr:HNH endonuclease [Escherichia phage vB_EcoS_AKS96]AHI60705.1 HNH endonuclease [Escherichia phage vB_EcoS_AKS96]